MRLLGAITRRATGEGGEGCCDAGVVRARAQSITPAVSSSADEATSAAPIGLAHPGIPEEERWRRRHMGTNCVPLSHP